MSLSLIIHQDKQIFRAFSARCRVFFESEDGSFYQEASILLRHRRVIFWEQVEEEEGMMESCQSKIKQWAFSVLVIVTYDLFMTESGMASGVIFTVYLRCGSQKYLVKFHCFLEAF